MPLVKAHLAAACLLLLASRGGAFDPASYTLPPGFSIAIYSDSIPQARSIAVSKRKGAVITYVSSWVDKLYAVVDKNGDGMPEYTLTILSGFGNLGGGGIAWIQGSLFVAPVSKILRLDNIDQYALKNKPYDKQPAIIIDTLPTSTWHGFRYLNFGPDGKLYVSIGSPCNVCKPDVYKKNSTSPSFLHGTIYRMNLDGSGMELHASGIRNSVGFDWAANKKMYFTDNGRDSLGDNLPDDEFNLVPEPGAFFGFPYCHTEGKGGPDKSPYKRKPGVGAPLPDPDLNPGGANFPCQKANFTAAIQAMGPHVAALGMRVYKSQGSGSFPKEYDKSIFIAQHGSWNRKIRIGYRVMRVVLNQAGTRVVKYEPFVTGWLQNEGSPQATVTGRPVDVQKLADGSLLISDDLVGCVYRVTYQKPKSA